MIANIKAETGKRGDVNLDGELNIRDAAALARMLSEGEDMEAFFNSLAGHLSDYNKDGKINVRDAAAMAKFLAVGKSL